MCYVNECTGTDIKVTKAPNPHELLQFFKPDGSDTADCNSQEPTEDIPLCSHHYMQWYRHTHSLQSKCKTCGESLRRYTNSHPVPEPELLQNFLQANTNFNDSLHPDDRVCNVCYRSHFVIVKHIKKSVISTDLELRVLISELRHSVPSLSGVKSFEQAVSYTVRSLAVGVGEALLKQAAMLLPEL